jgi:hypothetical protein
MSSQLGDDRQHDLMTAAERTKELTQVVVVGIGVELSQTDPLERGIAKQRFQNLEQSFKPVRLTNSAASSLSGGISIVAHRGRRIKHMLRGMLGLALVALYGHRARTASRLPVREPPWPLGLRQCPDPLLGGAHC